MANTGTLSIADVEAAQTLTFTWTEQFYITVDANGHGTPTQSSQFVNQTLGFSTSVTSPADTVTNDHQWMANTGTLSITDVEAPQTLTFTWTEQFYITVDANGHGTPTQSSQFVNQTLGFSTSVTSPADTVTNDHQWMANTGTLSITDVEAPQTLTFTWTEQFYITVDVNGHGTPTQSSQFVNQTLGFSTSVTSPADTVTNDHQWMANTGTLSITDVEAPQTLTFTWTEQFYITVDANGHGTPTQSSQFVNQTLGFSTSVTSPADTVTNDHQWMANTGTLSITDVDAHHTLTFTWTEQFYNTVDANAHETPTQSSQFVNQTLGFSTSVTSPADTVTNDH